MILVDYNKCVEEPGFCLNGATCERTWTSARCNCADRYQGDRCQQCAENLYGDDSGKDFNLSAETSMNSTRHLRNIRLATSTVTSVSL